MKKFLYLRIMAVTTMVLIAACMVGVLTAYINRGKLFYFMIGEASLAIMISHSILTLTIYTRWYPDQEISKAISVFYRISEAGCWIILLLLLASAAGNSFLSDKADYPTASLSLAVFALFLVQITGGRRLVKTINRNAREQFKDSFV